MTTAKKIIWSTVTVLLLAGIIFVYWKYYFVFAEGTKAGVLNTFQQKGFVFKTYEGKIIQSGFKANVQSNEFDFSVTDPKIALILEKNSGRELNLHYKRYLGALPWRGMQAYIVDSVLEIRGVAGETTISPK
ncbi:MAG: hypothetical protein PHD73_01900 [Sediminibacterium sp.]|nr:hypothetical protein [Sediminibacterium sp.]